MGALLKETRRKPRKRALDPGDRLSEALFGLIMALTFTGSLSVADAGRDDVRAMLIGALGCNLAWGIIDALFYLMGCLNEQGSRLRTLKAVRGAASPEEARAIVADALPSSLDGAFEAAEIDSIRRKLTELPDPPARPRLRREEWRGALSVLLWVFFITFPVAVPFMFLDNIALAMRVSNAVAVALLFLCGYSFGRIAGYRPLPTGLALVVLGGIIVALTIALGG